jgi:hypothetical protein
MPDEPPLPCIKFQFVHDYIEYMYYVYCKKDQVKWEAIQIFMLTEINKNQSHFTPI